MQAERLKRVAIVNQMGLIGNMHTRLRQRRIVITIECREMLRIALGRSVGAEEAVLEVYRHFGYNGITLFVLRSSNLNSRQQILLGIAAQHTHGQLAAGEHHRLGEVLQHERQCGRRIGHRVRTMQNDKAVIGRIIVIDHLRHAYPAVGVDIRRVQKGRESLYIHLYGVLKQLRHIGLESVHIRRHECTGRFIAHHGDGTTR